MSPKLLMYRNSLHSYASLQPSAKLQIRNSSHCLETTGIFILFKLIFIKVYLEYIAQMSNGFGSVFPFYLQHILVTALKFCTFMASMPVLYITVVMPCLSENTYRMWVSVLQKWSIANGEILRWGQDIIFPKTASQYHCRNSGSH